MKPKRCKQKDKCYKAIRHLGKKNQTPYVDAALYLLCSLAVYEQAGTSYTLTCVAAKLGKIKVCCPAFSCKDLRKCCRYVSYFSCEEGAKGRTYVRVGQTGLME